MFSVSQAASMSTAIPPNEREAVTAVAERYEETNIAACNHLEVANRGHLGPETEPRKRHKVAEDKDETGTGTSTGGGRRRGVFEGEKRRRARLIVEAAKIEEDSPNALPRMLAVVASVQAMEVLEGNPPTSFVGELLVQVIRLLPRALESTDGAAIFIECLGPFENLQECVLPASLYRAIASASESRPLDPRKTNTWRRAILAGESTAGSSPQVPAPSLAGLQTLREYLCMNGRDAVDCAPRTVVATLTRALLGSWQGSVDTGRALFDQSVLKSPNRSVSVGLGLEMLVQSLVQDDVDYRGTEKDSDAAAVVNREDSSVSDGEGGDSEEPPSRPSCVSRLSSMARSVPDEAGACVTIIGNYVRADADTAGAFFRDMIPILLVLGFGGGGGGGRGRGAGRGSVKRVPPRLAAVLRRLVDSTRSRNSFNVERMVMHTAREVKDWGDPADVSSSPLEHFSIDVEEEGSTAVGRRAATENRGASAGEKQRRRGLVLACLDILGLTRSCKTLIRREMVDGESKANLRSAVAEALLEYRRTCATEDVEAFQALSIGVLSDLIEDSFIGVRVSSLAAVGEAFSSDFVPAASLLLRRCLDASPKIRRLAVRLLVDDFGLGVGPEGASLARAVLLPSPSLDGRNATSRDLSFTAFGGWRAGREGNGTAAQGSVHSGGVGTPLGCLLQHRAVLVETDGERFPALLRGLVKAVLEDEDRGGLDRGEMSAVFGGDQPEDIPSPGTNGEGNGDGVVAGVTTASGRLDGEKGMTISSDDGGISDDHPLQGEVVGGAFSWEAFATPASRLCAACRPFDPAQLDVLDEIIGEIYRHR